MRRPSRWILFPAVFALTLAACGGGVPQRLAVGSTLPDFSLPSLAGGVFESDALEGKAVVLNFWATWCEPCMRELPELKAMADDGLEVIGIALDEEGERAVRPFVEKNGIPYTVLLGNQQIFQEMGGFSIPYTIVIDESRLVINIYRGLTSREDVARDLGGAAAAPGTEGT